jgi:hypothetical protein
MKLMNSNNYFIPSSSIPDNSYYFFDKIVILRTKYAISIIWIKILYFLFECIFVLLRLKNAYSIV